MKEKDENILNFIKHYFGQNGYAPSFRDIANGCSLSSTSLVAYRLNKLEQLGCIKRHSGIPRGIALMDQINA